MKRIRQILMLLICIAVMAVAAIQKNGKLLDYKLGEENKAEVKTETSANKEAEKSTEKPVAPADEDTTSATENAEAITTTPESGDSVSIVAEPMTTADDGTLVVNTSSLCKDVDGYAGPVPMEISIKDGVITDVKALPNDETPEFFEEARVIIDSWKGKTIEEGLQLQVDAVSGATFSSKAIITNIQKGLEYAVANMPKETATGDTLQVLDDGTLVINTTNLCKDVDGYAGPVPMEISIKDGVISDVKALPNDETPEFFEEARVIIANWRGKTIEEGLQLQVDAISGATFSSKAIITNIKEGLTYASTHMPDADTGSEAFSGLGSMALSVKSIIGLIVVLMAAIIPLFFKSKTFRTIQLLLNVVILGFWCGTFLNYTMFLRALSNGMDWWVDIIPIIMLITAFIYPLFGKKSYYCVNVCPFGSLQDLAGKLSKKKWKLSIPTQKALCWFRRILWIVLMGLMVSGIYFDWINYELFSAFIFSAASWVVIALAVVCVLLSIFVPRPYCRFVCPTGSLMKTAEGRFL